MSTLRRLIRRVQLIGAQRSWGVARVAQGARRTRPAAQHAGQTVPQSDSRRDVGVRPAKKFVDRDRAELVDTLCVARMRFFDSAGCLCMIAGPLRRDRGLHAPVSLRALVNNAQRAARCLVWLDIAASQS